MTVSSIANSLKSNNSKDSKGSSKDNMVGDTSSEATSIDYGYGDTEVSPTVVQQAPASTPLSGRRPSTMRGGIRLSSLPNSIRSSVAMMQISKDGSKEIGKSEIVRVIENLDNTTQSNKTLKTIVSSLCIFALLLVACTFGATITAARLTKDTEVDSVTGIMYAKQWTGDHSHQTTMKTEEVVIYTENTKIIDMTNNELQVLKEIILGEDEDIKFQVKGYARSETKSQVGLLVQGGTIIYDEDGIVRATGDAKVLLDLAFGEQEFDDQGIHGRYLASTCNHVKTGSGSGVTNKGRTRR